MFSRTYYWSQRTKCMYTITKPFSTPLSMRPRPYNSKPQAANCKLTPKHPKVKPPRTLSPTNLNPEPTKRKT